MRKYEYKVVNVDRLPLVRVEDIINEYGKLGWKLHCFREQSGISYVILEKEL